MISGNAQEGLEISGPSAAMTIQNNYFGTKPDGLAPLGNTFDGVYVYNTDAATVANNVIAGNSPFSGGDQVRFDYGTGGKIFGNTIGLAVDGNTALPASAQGVELNNTVETVVDANTISNSTSYGVYANATDSISVTNNEIGTNAAGTLDRGNYIGVYLSSSSESAVGTPGAATSSPATTPTASRPCSRTTVRSRAT